jgi:predicted permease
MGLALSIGISALAFTLLDTRFLSGGGIAESHAVSRVALLPSVFSRPTGDSPMQGNWTLVDFDRIRLGANTMALTASANVRRTLRTSDGSQTAVAGRAVTGNYFEALGAAATHGRLLAASDDRPGGAPVVVLSWALWRNLFGANARVVGQTVHLDDQAHVIVGVARRSFSGAGLAGLPPAAFWVPMSAAGDVWRAAEALRRTPSEPEVPWNPAVDVVGRLQEDATPSIAAAELHALAVALAPETLKAKTRIDLQPPNPRTPGEATSVAVAATLVVLLVVLAAANLAHLLVAGALAREPELALRRALGSSVWRLGRQLVAEALILGLTGAVIGSLLAAWATPVFAAAVGLPPTFDMSPSVGGAAFAAVIGVAAALFASLWPLHMLRQWSLRPTAFLDRRGHPGTRGRRSRAALLALQGATSLIAVAAAALLTRAAVQVATLDPGYQPDGLVEVRVGGYPRAYSAQQAWAFLSTALDRAGRRPDVAGGAAALVPPFSDVTMSQTTNGHRVSYNATTPAYFDVLGLRLVRGQVYGMASNEPVAMVSEGVARTFWGRTDPLGQTLEPVWGARNPFDPSTPPHTIRIIGVVSDAVTDLRSTNGLAV